MGSPPSEKGRGEDEMRRTVQILNPFTSLSLKQLFTNGTQYSLIRNIILLV